MTSRIGRNEPCPCGSGKKYERCCLHQHEATAERTAGATAQAAAQLAPPVFAWEDDDGLDEASNRVGDLVHDGDLDAAEQAARDLLVRHPDVHDGFERLAMVYEARGVFRPPSTTARRSPSCRTTRDNYDAEAIDWMRARAESMEQNR